MDTKFTTIQVSQDMRKQLRAIAQQQGRKMYALVDELLMAALATPRTARVVDGNLVADERAQEEARS